MQKRGKRQVRVILFLMGILIIWNACTPQEQKEVNPEMQAFEAFFIANGDSVSIAPRKVRTQALQKMREIKDSLVRYNYLIVASKTCMMSSDMDSVFSPSCSFM